MNNNKATNFEQLKNGFSKQPYESPFTKIRTFVEPDVVLTSFVQEPNGDTYRKDFEKWWL